MPQDPATRDTAPPPRKPTLARLFWEYLKISAFVVGGGYAIIAVADETFGRRLRWLREGELVDRLPVFQMIPGLIAGNSAIYVGLKLFGLAGAAIALAAAVRAALPEKDACVDVRPCAAPASHVAMRIERTSAPRGAGGRYVVSVTGPDSPGRIHRIAKVFAAHGANVEDWRHDLSDPARTLTIGVVTIPASADLEALRAALDAELAPLGLSTSLLQENIFRATNEVGPISVLLDPGIPDAGRNAPAR